MLQQTQCNCATVAATKYNVNAICTSLNCLGEEHVSGLRDNTQYVGHSIAKRMQLQEDGTSHRPCQAMTTRAALKH